MTTQPKERLLIYLVASLLLIAGAAWLNLRLFDQPASPLSPSQFYIHKVHATPSYDVVMSGNSRVLQALSPVAMKEQLPDQRILNFGLDGACLTPQLLAEIEKKLDPASRSPIILLGIEPGTLEEYSSGNRKLNIELARSKESRFLAFHTQNWGRWFAPVRLYAVASLFALWRDGPTVKNPAHVHEYSRDGWMASTVFPDNRIAVEQEYTAKLNARGDQPEKIALPYADAVMKQVREWTARGIRVFGARMPSDPSVQRYEDAAYDFNEAEIARHFMDAGGIWLPVEAANYHTYDGSHLDKNSAIVFSRDLAGKIKNHRP